MTCCQQLSVTWMLVIMPVALAGCTIEKIESPAAGTGAKQRRR